MTAILLIDIISLLCFSAALVQTCFIQKDFLGRMARLFLGLMITIYILVSLSNVLANSRVAPYFDLCKGYVEILFVPVFLSFMFCSGMFGEARERKKVEQALGKSEKRYRLLYRQTPAMLHSADRRGNLLNVNDRWLEVLGYEREEVIGRKFTQFLVEPSEKQGHLLFPEHLKRGSMRKIPHQLIKKSGEVIDVLITATRENDHKGNFLRSLVVIEDVSDFKKAEEAFKREKEKFQGLVEESPFAVSFIEKNGTYRYVNPKFTEIFGYTLADLTPGSEWFRKAFPDPIYRRQALTAWIHYLKSSNIGDARPVVFSVNCKDGIEKTIQFRPVTMTTGNQIVIYEDISERKQLEIQLHQAQKMEAIGTLAGGIAHDFNNILTPLIIYTEMAMMEIPDDSPAYANLQEVLKSSDRAKDLVNQILTFSRQSEQECRPLKIGLIIKEGLKLLRSSLPATIDIRYQSHTDSDKILADPGQIHQVLMHLCTNAYHAMRETGGVLEIVLTEEEVGAAASKQLQLLDSGSYLKLIVKDTGRGIDPAVIDKIFDPYFTDKEDVGSGLGLAVVHGIVKNLGGIIQVRSDVSVGTTFEVFLPQIKPVSHPLAEGQDTLPTPIPTGDERILFIDDEIELIQALGNVIKMLGYEVTLQLSSMEALDLFQQAPRSFDLIITDQTMPDLTGAQLALKIKKIRDDIPIILCTGFSELIDEDKAKEMGIEAFLMKPVVMREMATTIRNVLDARKT